MGENCEKDERTSCEHYERKMRTIAVGHLSATARSVAGRDRVADPGRSSGLGALVDVRALDLRDVVGRRAARDLDGAVRDELGVGGRLQGHLLKALLSEVLVLRAETVLVPTAVVRDDAPHGGGGGARLPLDGCRGRGERGAAHCNRKHSVRDDQPSAGASCAYSTSNLSEKVGSSHTAGGLRRDLPPCLKPGGGTPPFPGAPGVPQPPAMPHGSPTGAAETQAICQRRPIKRRSDLCIRHKQSVRRSSNRYVYATRNLSDGPRIVSNQQAACVLLTVAGRAPRVVLRLIDEADAGDGVIVVGARREPGRGGALQAQASVRIYRTKKTPLGHRPVGVL